MLVWVFRVLVFPFGCCALIVMRLVISYLFWTLVDGMVWMLVSGCCCGFVILCCDLICLVLLVR